jgi:adenylate cyclase class 2
VEEIEFEVSDVDQALLLLDRPGYPAYRTQQKRRHSFTLNGVIVDIDTWPRVPTYVELEGPDEAALREAAENLGLSWEDALIDDPRKVIETRYNIPVGSMRWFTFERFE